MVDRDALLAIVGLALFVAGLVLVGLAFASLGNALFNAYDAVNAATLNETLHSLAKAIAWLIIANIELLVGGALIIIAIAIAKIVE